MMGKTETNQGPDKDNEKSRADKQIDGGMAVKEKPQTAAKLTGGGKDAEERRGGGIESMTPAAGETARAATAAASTEERRAEEQKKEVKKELVVNVEVEGGENIAMLELLNAVGNACGRVLGCRAKGEWRWELTMSNPRGKERLLDGIKIRGCRIIASEVARDQRIVSFLNLPLYITDEDICHKLQLWGVEPVSPIRRRKWTGTDIFDGTRFLKVKFSDTVSSLPYSTRFDTLEGVEYFRVLHDHQQKVCRLCLQPGHILRECPEFKCFKCGGVGHYARECTDSRCSCEADGTACMSGLQEEKEGDTGDDEGEEMEEGEGPDGAEGADTAAQRATDGQTEEEEEDSGVTAAFTRPGRPPHRASTLRVMEHWAETERTQKDRSHSGQRGQSLQGNQVPLPCGQPAPGLAQSGPREPSSDSELEEVKKERGKGGKTSKKGRKKGKNTD